MERNTYPKNPNADIMMGYFFDFSKEDRLSFFSTNDTYKYENCIIHGYSIVYIESKKDFYIISDAVCNGIPMPIYRLFGELSEEEKQPPVTETPVSEDLLYDSCDKCPDELCEIDLTCSREGDCKDQLYYGDKCDQSCEEISPLCIKCSRDGKCLECSDKHYFGVSCYDLCDKCPEGTCDIDGICTDISSDCVGQKYFGTKCDTKCKNDFCEKCDRNGKCLEC